MEEATASSQKNRRNPAEHLRPYQFKPGQSGNPSGRPKKDIAAEIAQAIFEQNPEAIYKAMGKRLLKGDAKAFTALADRGYGKAPQPITGGDGNELQIVVRHIGSRNQPSAETE